MQGLIGKELSDKRFHVQELLGHGGMADVYKVWDRPRATYLAMKVLRGDPSLDDEFVLRFRQEAQALEKLNHRNIVRFYGLKQDDDLIFMLLEYVEGETLKQLIEKKNKPFTLREIIGIMRRICAALNFAHQRGFIHCDIKPGNILIGIDKQVYLTDFGIAYLVGQLMSQNGLTSPGTPSYMAPEQIRGETPQPQTDIYALGLILYEMFTGGSKPFNGKKAEIDDTSRDKIRWEQLNLDAPSPYELNPKISIELEEVVLKALEKDIDARFQNTLEMFVELSEASTSVAQFSTLTINQRGEDELDFQEDMDIPVEIMLRDIETDEEQVFINDLQIGRALDNDLIIDDPQISNYHAEIVYQESGYFLIDNSSTNGTFLNDYRITAPIQLVPGAIIRLGDTRFEVGISRT